LDKNKISVDREHLEGYTLKVASNGAAKKNIDQPEKLSETA